MTGWPKLAEGNTDKHAFQRGDALIFFGGITALTAISIDIILPATGVIARAFGVKESLGALLVGSYFLAYAAGMMFWGLFSDAYGRRLALILSLIGFTASSLLCALAPSFEILILGRVLQGLTGGAPVIARAMVRDVTSGNEAARILTVLTAILTVATLIAPVLGSGLLVLFEWRAIFWALTLLGLIFLTYTVLVIKETGGERRPERFSWSFVSSSSRKLFSLPAYVVPTMFGSFAFAGYAAILSVGAVLTENVYDVSPQAFGSLFALAALANTCGALSARQMLKTVPLARITSMAVALLGLAAVVSLVSALTTPTLPLFWAVVCLYVFCFGMVYPTSVALALEPADEMPGFASSLMSTIQTAMGAGGAALATILFDGSHRAIPITMAIFGLLAVGTLLWKRRALQV